MQVLGNLYPQMEARRGQAAVEHFKSAAEKPTSSGQVLEMLGELLATSNPAGTPHHCTRRALTFALTSPPGTKDIYRITNLSSSRCPGRD